MSQEIRRVAGSKRHKPGVADHVCARPEMLVYLIPADRQAWPRKVNHAPRLQNSWAALCVIVVLALLSVKSARCAAADDAAPIYPEHQELGSYLDAKGARHEIRTIADWEIRRRHILANMQLVMG